MEREATRNDSRIFRRGIDIYKKLGAKLNVPLGNFSRMEMMLRDG